METLTDLPSIEQCEKATQTKYYLASGCYRTAYWIPGTKWVYKVDDRDGNATNKREYEMYLQFSPSLRDDIRIAEMHLLENGVIAAEYVEGAIGNIRCWEPGGSGCSRQCENNCWAKRIAHLAKQLRDLHYANIRIADDNTIYLIDLGEGLRQTETY